MARGWLPCQPLPAGKVEVIRARGPSPALLRAWWVWAVQKASLRVTPPASLPGAFGSAQCSGSFRALCPVGPNGPKVHAHRRPRETAGGLRAILGLPFKSELVPWRSVRVAAVPFRSLVRVEGKRNGGRTPRHSGLALQVGARAVALRPRRRLANVAPGVHPRRSCGLSGCGQSERHPCGKTGPGSIPARRARSRHSLSPSPLRRT